MNEGVCGGRKGIKGLAAMRSLPKSVARGGAPWVGRLSKRQASITNQPEHDDSGGEVTPRAR